MGTSPLLFLLIPSRLSRSRSGVARTDGLFVACPHVRVIVSTLVFSAASVAETVLEDRVPSAPLVALLCLTFVRFVVFEAMAVVR